MHDPSNGPLGPPPQAPDEALDLTRSILARTSGSPCARVKDLACDFVDGALEEARCGLVRDHLGHCRACAALVTVLERNTALLPRLAELDPGPWFTARVLRATVHAPPRPSLDWRALGSKLLHRPRIALEAAYLGAALSVVGFALPTPASLPAPRAIVRAVSPMSLLAPLGPPAQRVGTQLVRAEQRTVAGLARAFKLDAVTHDDGAPARTLWQRSSRSVLRWVRAFGGSRAEKPSAPPNP